MVSESGYVPDVDWTEGIRDAGRISIERLIADEQLGRSQFSQGALRLTGGGVVNHTASTSDVATVLLSFQRLVTAIGASLSAGNTSLRGQIASNIVHRTRLRLAASPAPGSLVLDLVPESPPEQETSPGGAASMFGEPEPLADQVMSEVVTIISEAGQLGPDPDTSPLLTRIEQLGARTGAAVRAFTLALANSDFDTDLDWQVPTHATAHARLSRDQARELARLVEARNLDAEPFEIVGEMRTVSDLSAWVIDAEDGERYQVDGSQIAPEIVNALHTHSRVRVLTEMTPTRHVGGSFRYTYTARDVELLS